MDVSVIPLFINIGDKGYLDGVDLSREDFYSNLAGYDQHPTTGTPGIKAFLDAYRKLAAEGAQKIISIHISEELSATIAVARQAAVEFSDAEVIVIDSGQLSLGTGFQVEAAARMAQEGRTSAEILAAVADLRSRTFVTAGLDTLEFLRRSGRMNRFMHGLGSLIQLKPILTMKNGQPGSDRVRTRIRADKRLIALLEENLPLERFALLHTNAKEQAAEFKRKVEKILPEREVLAVDITPVIGAHLGPGAVGFAVISKNPV